MSQNCKLHAVEFLKHRTRVKKKLLQISFHQNYPFYVWPSILITLISNKNFGSLKKWFLQKSNCSKDRLGWIGNCDIDFYNFCHRKVWNFEISNQFERHQNFTVIFRRWSESESQKRTSQLHVSLLLYHFISFVKLRSPFLTFAIAFVTFERWLRFWCLSN